ncbi:hypothetical protein CRUP_030200 [Coryphaenoides rupestris]|nr:hypothetical protein CRUP_030200 [Coryphaenoides rupestris]
MAVEVAVEGPVLNTLRGRPPPPPPNLQAARGPPWCLRPPVSPYSASCCWAGGLAAQPPLPPQQQQQRPGACSSSQAAAAAAAGSSSMLCARLSQKLIQAGPTGLSGAPAKRSACMTVSESPENRLCENGLTLEQHQHLHHQHQHHLHQQHQQHLHHQHLHQHQHHQHHHPQYQQSLQHDHIQRLFQVQAQAQAQVLVPVPVSTAPCCSNPLPPPLVSALQHPAQPITVESVAYPHPQHNQQHVYFSPCKPLPDPQAPSSQPASGVPPHELLQKLQLVQQEQSQTTHEAPRHGPALAPRFQGATPTQDPGSALGPGNEARKHFPVLSPQRIPATVALLLSPSVFSQAKGAVIAAAAVGPPLQDSCPLPVPVAGPAAPRGPPVPEQQARLLSRNQLQETLLHLLQTDSSFIDCIYKAYVGGLAKGPGSKY